MAVAQKGTTLVTGGWDKTVRIWSLATPDGKPRTAPMLRDILSVPVGQGRTGEARAVAISPDESLVAVGGRMASEGNPEAERIYVFDTLTARIVAVLPMASQVASLAWSPDGRHLAAGADSGSVGLCVWSTGNWQLAGHDKAYGGSIRGLSFSADGRLGASSLDGRLRIYEGAFGSPARRHDFPAATAAQQPAGMLAAWRFQ
jgi:dipeptidyl aminopeptidase/acylaminoacyl peptidase